MRRSVSRIAERVLRGGHDIPEAVVRRRFAKSFDHLQEALCLSDGALIFDNTWRRLGQVVTVRDGQVSSKGLDLRKPHHARIADAVHQAITAAGFVADGG